MSSWLYFGQHKACPWHFHSAPISHCIRQLLGSLRKKGSTYKPRLFSVCPVFRKITTITGELRNGRHLCFSCERNLGEADNPPIEWVSGVWALGAVMRGKCFFRASKLSPKPAHWVDCYLLPMLRSQYEQRWRRFGVLKSVSNPLLNNTKSRDPNASKRRQVKIKSRLAYFGFYSNYLKRYNCCARILNWIRYLQYWLLPITDSRQLVY